MPVRYVLLLMIGVFGLVGCATAPPRNPQAEAGLLEANSALDALNAEMQRFYSDLDTLRQQIAGLYQQPGWPDMRRIIESNPAIVDHENPISELEKMPASDAWTEKWNRPWQSLFLRYLGLVDRCIAMEIRRAALRSSLTSLQAKYIAIAVSELTSQRYDQGKYAYDTEEMISEWLDELDSYGTDKIGLYPVNY